MVWECRYRNVKRAVWSMSQVPAIATRLEGSSGGLKLCSGGHGLSFGSLPAFE